MMTVECLPKSAIQSISVLLVDDNHQFRRGLETLLGFYHTTGSLSCRVVGHAASVEQGLQLMQEQQPQLILLDMELAQHDGVTFLIKQRQLRQPSRVLVLSAHQEDEWVFRAMQAGACGYVFKDRLAHQLSEAIAR